MSSLESLPTEILEIIFLSCLNINLPLASRTLHTRLSSPHSVRQFRILSRKTKYTVWPIDNFKTADYSSTEKELERITEARSIYSWSEYGVLQYWTVYANVVQKEDIDRVAAVEAVLNSNVQDSRAIMEIMLGIRAS